MKEKVLEIAKEMLLEAGADIGQEFQAATNTQLRDWGERLAAAAKGEDEEGRTATPRQDADADVLEESARALRSALEPFGYIPDEDLQSLEKTAKEMQDGSVYGGGALENLVLLARNAKKALGERVPNYMRYKTPEEAQAAFLKLCKGRHGCGPHCWYHPIDLKAACSFRFLYDTKPHDWSDVTKGGQA